jgi:hypothetical protein
MTPVKQERSLMDLQALTNEQKQQLLEEIARIAEHSFRRGFQQGHLVGQGKFRSQTRIPSEQEVAEWRFFDDLNEAKPHPGSSYTKTGYNKHGRGSNSILDRLDCQVSNCNAPQISRLLKDLRL